MTFILSCCPGQSARLNKLAQSIATGVCALLLRKHYNTDFQESQARYQLRTILSLVGKVEKLPIDSTVKSFTAGMEKDLFDRYEDRRQN